MALRVLVLAAALALGGLAASTHYDWGDDKEWAKEYPASKGICRSVARRTIPAADQADAKTAAALKGCDAEALYFGIGRPRDVVRGRQCAMLNMRSSNDADLGPFDGRAILVDAYANGAGVKRDVDLAIHLACGLDAAPMEHDGRITSLAAMRGQAHPETFSLCQDMTSGIGMGACANQYTRIAQAGRTAEAARLGRSWTTAQRAAYARLVAAREAFVGSVSRQEVDQTGTLRGAFVSSEEDVRQQSFHDLLGRLAAGRGPQLRGLATADARLNAAYRETLARVGAEEASAGFIPGGVTREGVREAQRLWIAYRDSWLAFAKATYPAASQEGLATWLTIERTIMLQNTPRSQEDEEPKVPEP